MKKNILLINLCKEKLHFFEFVKPVEDILTKNKIKYFARNYKKLKKKDLLEASEVIICGTSLYDNEFFKNIDKFAWIKNYKKPILGICGGMQIIGMIFREKLKRKTKESNSFLKKKTEIGFYKEKFKKEFLGLEGEEKVYHLHNYYIDFLKLKEFEVFSGNKSTQAVKHKKKEIYGVLFHPEVRNKDLIQEFISINN